jgi:hypothetical protein
MPEHEVDHNAIAVIGFWEEEDRERHGQLGYIPADLAAQLKNEEQDTVIGATLKAIYVPVSGRSAGPAMASRGRGLRNPSHDEFLATVRRLNGTPKELLENPEWTEVFLPLLRADFAVAGPACSCATRRVRTWREP